MYPKKDNTLAILGGAALGAVAMYLLDPETGEQRRRDLAEKTGDATHRAGETLEPLWERVSDSARSYGSTLAAGASTWGHSALEKLGELRDGTSHAAHSAGHAASHAASNAGEHASDFASNLGDSLKRAGQRARDAARTPAQWFHPEPESHAGAYAATGIGAVLLGAAAMYAFDPERGQARRNKIAEQLTSVVRRTGRRARQVGKDVRNRTAGYAHEARGAFHAEDAVSADKLLQTIRSEIGHVVSRAGEIQVMTDNHGRVTLHGKVLASEVDKLMSTVNGISGVNEVTNLLSVKDSEQQMTENTGGSTSSTNPVARM